MGQKVNPICIRIGINRLWDSKWYANKKQYSKLLHQDLNIEKSIRKKLTGAGISKIEILRNANAVTLNIHTAKPGMIIGRGGEKIEILREQLDKEFDQRFTVNIVEIKKPSLDARLLAESIGNQVSRRISYRRAAKMGIDKAMEAGALGVKVRVAGRLNGVEIARNEFFSKGKVPLHTFRADIDYANYPAGTTFGIIGIKVWIYKGDVFKPEETTLMAEAATAVNAEIEEPKGTTKKKAPAKKATTKKVVAKKTTKKATTKKVATKKTTKK